MLAICEECSKKYNVDESKIKGERARFACKECGHVIVVTKPPTNSQAPGSGNDPITKNPA